MITKVLGALCGGLCLAAFLMASDRSVVLRPGDVAPAFAVPDETDKIIELASLRGKKVVLFFYPRNFTTGCTQQVCELRDSFHRYKEEDIVLLGINYASSASHASFKAHHHVPFSLLSDRAGRVAKKYGAYKGWFRWFVPARMTFIIDEQGIVRHVLDNVDVKKHAEQVIELCHQLDR